MTDAQPVQLAVDADSMIPPRSLGSFGSEPEAYHFIKIMRVLTVAEERAVVRRVMIPRNIIWKEPGTTFESIQSSLSANVL